MLMIDLHLFALNCNESFRIVVDEKEKRAKLCCLTLSILVFYVKCFIINLLGPPDAYSNRAELHPVVLFNGCKSTYLRGICKIFRRFFAQKKRFLIGFIYKFLLLSGIVDGCNGIRFPLFALSYF